MFGNFDEFGRPRRQSVRVSPAYGGHGRQPRDWREAYLLLQQEYEKLKATAVAWQQEAEKWRAAGQQQNGRTAQPAQLQKELTAARQTIATLEENKTELENRLTEADEWQDKYTRLYAEFENSKKRLAQRYATEAAEEKEKLLRDILPIVDNLERALAHAMGTAEEIGIALTLKAFTAVLQQHSVEPIVAEGQPFDPKQHEAVSTIANSGQETGTITAVTEKGYRLNGKLLRPARVLVAE